MRFYEKTEHPIWMIQKYFTCVDGMQIDYILAKRGPAEMQKKNRKIDYSWLNMNFTIHYFKFI